MLGRVPNFVEHFFQDKQAFSQIIRTGAHCPFPNLNLMRGRSSGKTLPFIKFKEDAGEFYFVLKNIVTFFSAGDEV